jgi:hypothetical protein
MPLFFFGRAPQRPEGSADCGPNEASDIQAGFHCALRGMTLLKSNNARPRRPAGFRPNLAVQSAPPVQADEEPAK